MVFVVILIGSDVVNLEVLDSDVKIGVVIVDSVLVVLLGVLASVVLSSVVEVVIMVELRVEVFGVELLVVVD